MDEDWDEILRHSKELCELFPEGLAFIGGVGVFAHTQAHPSLCRFTAFSHDGDLVIAQADFMDLRDLEVVTTNRRLNKHEFRRNRLQFDVYEEGSSGLIVPVAEIIASSRNEGGLRVACLEHLLALKLEAYRDRQATPKGEKDAADAFKLVLLTTDAEVQKTRLAYLNDDHVEDLKAIRRAPTALRLAEGNSHDASSLNKSFDRSLAKIMAARDNGQANDDTGRPFMKKGGTGYGE